MAAGAKEDGRIRASTIQVESPTTRRAKVVVCSCIVDENVDLKRDMRETAKATFAKEEKNLLAQSASK